MENKKLITFEYGSVSHRYSIKAKNKLTAYVGMLLHFKGISHLIILYSPDEMVKKDKWFNPYGNISKRIDKVFGGVGSFDKYMAKHKEECIEAYKTIKQLV